MHRGGSAREEMSLRSHHSDPPALRCVSADRSVTFRRDVILDHAG